jgi:HTH-type transcriptional regulator / antitoxin HigA
MKKKPLQGNAKLPSSFEELVQQYPPRAIRDEADYENTQEIIDQLTNLPKLTPGQGEYLDTLATLLHAYEDQHWPIETSELGTVETLRFLMEERKTTARDLEQVVGSRSVVAKLLRGKADLTQSQIRALASFFQINPSLLV